MREALPRFEACGAKLLGVVCQKRSGVERFFAKDPLPFPLLIDEDRSRARAWGVYHRLGIDAVHIAHPSTFVVDERGIVRLASVAPDQFRRIPVDEVLARLASETGV